MKGSRAAAFLLCLAVTGGPLRVPGAGPPASQSTSLTPEEILRQGYDAYRISDWPAADAAFSRFLTEYGSNPKAAAAVGAISPFLTMARIRQGRLAEALPILESCLRQTKPPDPRAEELAFWLGICQMQTGNFQAAREALLQFARSYPNSPRRNEALLLAGTVLVVQEKNPEAADYFQPLLETLHGLDRGRAVSLLLYSFISSNRLDEALALITKESKRTNEILQIAGFQLLALELGSKFLEIREHRKAIAAFQRVWPRERVIQTQESRLRYLKNRKAALEAQGAPPDSTFQLTQSITKIERELAGFRKMKNYDSGLRLRLATAFLEMERYREAALVMESMLQAMEADPIVEQASISLMQCWLAVERWPKVAEAASLFETKFPNSEKLPMALFLKGQAEQSGARYAESVATFETLARRFTKSSLVPRASFMAGFGELLQERYGAAKEKFEEVCANYPDDPMADPASYWTGIALSLDRKFPEAREELDEYIGKHKKGEFLADAEFQKAYCAQSMRDYGTSVSELKKFLRDHPKSAKQSEALLLLGDAYFAQGEIERGIDTYKRIAPADTRFFEEGYFKIGKALRVSEKISALRGHMEKFRVDYPKSPRLAEALYWTGWSYRQENRPDDAKAIYWSSIEEHGNNSEIPAVEDIFIGLAKLYPPEEQTELIAKLRSLHQAAKSDGRKALATRCLWATGNALRKQEPATATLLFLEAAEEPSTMSPRLLADLAEAAEQAEKQERAVELFLTLLRWNPRCSQKDRALAGLGKIALAKGDTEGALSYFDRFEEEISDSSLSGEIRLARAKILSARAEENAAQATLENLLASKQSKSHDKAEALLCLGDLLMKKGEYGQAIAYFQRVYVMYHRWPDFVARAYLQSGRAFENLEDPESALKTYREMIGRPELASLEASREAQKRIEQLEGK